MYPATAPSTWVAANNLLVYTCLPACFFLVTAGPMSDEPPPIGSIHRGVVHTVKPFGVFVAIEGYRRHVLVHHSQVRIL